MFLGEEPQADCFGGWMKFEEKKSKKMKKKLNSKQGITWARLHYWAYKRIKKKIRKGKKHLSWGLTEYNVMFEAARCA